MSGIIEELDREDYGGYDNSGWVCMRDGETYGLDRFSHCSCCDTWDSIGMTYNWEDQTVAGDINSCEWSGSRSELIALCRGRRDPSMPERELNEDDYDSKLLLPLMERIAAWPEECE